VDCFHAHSSTFYSTVHCTAFFFSRDGIYRIHCIILLDLLLSVEPFRVLIVVFLMACFKPKYCISACEKCVFESLFYTYLSISCQNRVFLCVVIVYLFTVSFNILPKSGISTCKLCTGISKSSFYTSRSTFCQKSGISTRKPHRSLRSLRTPRQLRSRDYWLTKYFRCPVFVRETT
jgi:hypothetical protein